MKKHLLALSAGALCLTFWGTLSAQQSNAMDDSLSARGRELGSASGPLSAVPVIVIDSGEIAASGVRTLSELLIARVAGLTVIRSTGGVTGNSLIRLRGIHSILGPSSPIIIVDGIRIAANQRTSVISADIVQPSELDHIDVDDVALVEIRSGAAAGAAFGPDAGDGVILVTTKSGGRRPVIATARARGGVAITDGNWPMNYRLNGISTSTGQPVSPCLLWHAANGDCIPTTLNRTNPFAQASPFRIGRTASAHSSAAGALGATTYYVSGTTDWDAGTVSNDDVGRLGVHAHLLRRLPGGFVASAEASALHETQTLPDAGSLLATNVIASGLFGSGINDSLHGYLYAPYSLHPHTRAANATRAGVTVQWQPASWFEASSTYGRDRVVPTEDLSPTSYNGQATRLLDGVRTFAGMLTVRYPLGSSLKGATTLSAQHVESGRSWRDSMFQGSPSYSTSAITTGRLQPRTGGFAVAEELMWGDRLTADGILWRGQAMTIDGAPVTERYPAALVAWRMSDLGGRGVLRLHASYGESGSGSMDLAAAAFTVQSYGITSSRPAANERTIERVVGADMRVGRLTMRLDRFQSTSSHLFVAVPTACTFICLRILQGASVTNTGTELTLHTTLLDQSSLRWDASLVASTLRNRLTYLPSAPFYSGSERYVQGYPLGGLWGETYSYADANGDHVLGSSEVLLSSPNRYLGSSVPTFESGILSDVAFGRRVSGFVHLDYRAGQKRPDINEQWRCAVALNCRGLMDSSAPLADQASALFASYGELNPYVQSARFLRLHAIAVSWHLTTAWTRWIGPSSSISLTGYDLVTWTPYRGLDPELETWTAGAAPTYDLARTPILPRLEFRLDVGESPFAR